MVMSSVRINYYGLIPMTKFAYLVALVAAGGLALFVLLLGALLNCLPPLDTMWSREHHLAEPGVFAVVHNYLYWIIVVCLIAQVIDTFTTLRLFAKKEREQRALLDKLLQEEQAAGAKSPAVASRQIQGRIDRIQ
jgi:hypothetical protein